MADEENEFADETTRVRITALFQSSRTYTELCGHVISFLRGDLPATPTHSKPSYRETRVMLDDLVAINQLGFMTINSQLGYNDETEKGRSVAEAESCLRFGRAYIAGYIPNAWVSTFKTAIDAEPCVLDINGKVYVQGVEQPGNSIPVFHSNTKHGDLIWVDTYAVFGYDRYLDIKRSTLDDLGAYLCKHLTPVQVVHMEWGNHGLSRIVRGAVEKAHAAHGTLCMDLRDD